METEQIGETEFLDSEGLSDTVGWSSEVSGVETYYGAIARICHEANRAYCLAIGDNSQLSWEDTPDNIKCSVQDGVSKVYGNPNITPEELHQSWYDFKVADGWMYGPIKDASADPPTHPNIVPCDLLSHEQRVKDSLFFGVAKAMVSAEISQNAPGIINQSGVTL